MRKINQMGLDLIKRFEGYRGDAYQDSVGIWTIGYGTIKYPDGTKVKQGDTCTEAQAESYLANDLTTAENGVSNLVKASISDNQYAALVSFAYNLGLGNLGSSTLLKKVNAGDFTGASEEFTKWNKAGGKVIDGLTKRRMAEKELFLT